MWYRFFLYGVTKPSAQIVVQKSNALRFHAELPIVVSFVFVFSNHLYCMPPCVPPGGPPWYPGGGAPICPRCPGGGPPPPPP